jgi:hemerythrin superfamily protein
MAKPEDENKTPTRNPGEEGVAGSGASAARADAATSTTGSSAAGQASAGAQGSQAQTGADAIALLKADHRKVDALFKQYESAPDNRKAQLIQQISRELVVHTMIEEEIFYPACRRAASDEEPLDEAQVEHDSAKVLIADLMETDGRDQYRDAKVTVLAEMIRHHVKEEEEPSAGIFARAQSAGVNTADLARRVTARKQELEGRTRDLEPSRPVSLHPQRIFQGRQQEDSMARQDETGRERDDRGRFMSDDDDRRYSSRGRDDDDRGRGRGGWFGDPEGHSEAARRGWDERDDERSRSTRSRDDDRRYSSRSRDDDDRRDRGQGGWFGDSRGHSEAARRGWEDRH